MAGDSAYKSPEVHTGLPGKRAGTGANPGANGASKLKIALERASVCLLLLCAAGVTSFERSVVTWEYLTLPLLLGLVSIVISLSYGVKISRHFFVFIIFYLLLFFAQTLYYGTFHIKQMLLYPFNFWVAYCFVRAMKLRFLIHLEVIITFLAGVSLFIWLADVLSGGGVQSALVGYSFGELAAPERTRSYIVVQTFIFDGVDLVPPRNSGFAWEPGAFAVFCCVGLLSNFYRNNGSVRDNFGATILLLGLLSSQSTTGFSILGLLIIARFWSRMRGLSRGIIVPIIGGGVLVGLFALPFMQEKIVNLWSEDVGQIAYVASQSWNVNRPVTAQRFVSFQMDFADFLNNPWTGYGGRESEQFATREGINVVSISGIGKILGRFGIVGFAFFIWATARSSAHLNRIYEARSPLLLFSLIVMVSISYSIIEQPMFLAIWCYWFFVGPQIVAPTKKTMTRIFAR